MECKDYREQFPLLFAGTADRTMISAIEKHLAGCEECRQEFEDAGKIWELMGEIPQPEPPDSMKAGFEAICRITRENLLKGEILFATGLT